jgi:DNA invertase Pin-like site-specific DNA recombinase
MPTAAIYVRTAPGESPEGLDRQEHEARGLAVANGYEVGAVNRDTGEDAETFSELIEAVRAGGIDAVVVTDLSRLGRGGTRLQALIDAELAVIVTARGVLDLTTETGQETARAAGAPIATEP